MRLGVAIRLGNCDMLALARKLITCEKRYLGGQISASRKRGNSRGGCGRIRALWLRVVDARSNVFGIRYFSTWLSERAPNRCLLV